MGLQMILRRSHSVWNWEGNVDPKIKKVVMVTNGLGEPLSWIDTSRVTEVVETVAVWERFYPLHEWMIYQLDEFVPGHNIIVPQETLAKLLEILKRITEEPECAEELFAESEFYLEEEDDRYGDAFWQDVTYTIITLEKLFAEEAHESCMYYYEASW